jgi:hypothetical protein
MAKSPRDATSLTSVEARSRYVGRLPDRLNVEDVRRLESSIGTHETGAVLFSPDP